MFVTGKTEFCKKNFLLIIPIILLLGIVTGTLIYFGVIKPIYISKNPFQNTNLSNPSPTTPHSPTTFSPSEIIRNQQKTNIEENIPLEATLNNPSERTLPANYINQPKTEEEKTSQVISDDQTENVINRGGITHDDKTKEGNRFPESANSKTDKENFSSTTFNDGTENPSNQPNTEGDTSPINSDSPTKTNPNNQPKPESNILPGDFDKTNKQIDITKIVEEDNGFKVFVKRTQDLGLKFPEKEIVAILKGPTNTEGNIISIINELNRELKLKVFNSKFIKDTDEINVENKTLLLILWYFYDLRNNEQEKYETYKAIMDSILNWFCMEHYSDGSIKWLHSDESEKKGCLDKFGCADNRRIFYNFFFYYRWFMGRDVAKQISDLLKKDNVI